MIQIKLSVHENYVRTEVTFYHGENGITSDTFSRFGVLTMQNIITYAGDNLYAFVRDLPEPPIDTTKPYFNGFDGFLKIELTCLDETDLTKFEVTEARYIDKNKGGRSIKGAFRNEKFKRPILLNICNCIADMNVEKLMKSINALDSVGG